MRRFSIPANECLKTPIDGWYYSEYHGGFSSTPGRIENMICTIKNDISIKASNDPALLDAVNKLRDILIADLTTIRGCIDSELTVCVVPRAKTRYMPHQLKFKETIRNVISQIGLGDGTDYIIRITDTRTTHRNRAGYGGNGSLPYPGITKDTCYISDDVNEKTILLVDDVYTPSINIDEDAIQALLDRGASKVFFYSIGYTV